MSAFADPALSNWWIVRASDGKCVVVDIEPTGKDKNVTKIGKDVYQTPDQAEADAKRFSAKKLHPQTNLLPSKMSALGHKQTSVQRPRHVCFTPEADIRQCVWHVRFVPIADFHAG